VLARLLEFLLTPERAPSQRFHQEKERTKKLYTKAPREFAALFCLSNLCLLGLQATPTLAATSSG
jgi:hypothetical protein